METIICTEPELNNLAEKIVQQLTAGDVLALEGPLAAGKTTFTHSLLQAMGYQGAVNSPTFVIEHRYPVEFGAIRTVIHLDLYRLKADDLAAFDWPEYLAVDDQLTIIEWPDRASSYLPPTVKTVTIEIINDRSRRFRFTNHPPR